MLEMKKLVQARVPLWLYKFVHRVAEQYALSDSVLLGTFMCLGVILMTSTIKGEDSKECLRRTGLYKLDRKALRTRELSEADLHDFISKVFFETRKAVEEREKNMK